MKAKFVLANSYTADMKLHTIFLGFLYLKQPLMISIGIIERSKSLNADMNFKLKSY